MSGKRLRIRARVKLSEHNLDWLAGHVVGHEQGIVKGAVNESKKQAQEKARLLSEIVQLEQDLATARAAAALNARTVEDHRGRIIELEQEAVMLRQPAKSDWLSLPPFVVNVDPSLGPDEWAMTTTGRSRPGNMVVRARGRTPPQPHIDQIAAAYGGFINPEQSRRFIEQIINRPGLLSQTRVVPMRPPGNPSFYWNAEHEQAEDGEPLTELRDFSEHVEMNVREVRAAHRLPFAVASEMRTPEAEEGVRRASAEGVTNVAGGHSHSIDLDIRVDDSQMQDAVRRIDELSGVMANAVVSTEAFEEAMSRILRLERTMGVEDPPEESAGEENVDAGARSGSQGREHS